MLLTADVLLPYRRCCPSVALLGLASELRKLLNFTHNSKNIYYFHLQALLYTDWLNETRRVDNFCEFVVNVVQSFWLNRSPADLACWLQVFILVFICLIEEKLLVWLWQLSTRLVAVDGIEMAWCANDMSRSRKNLTYDNFSSTKLSSRSSHSKELYDNLGLSVVVVNSYFKKLVPSKFSLGSKSTNLKSHGIDRT